MEKLVCDKCGFELTEKEDIYLALDGKKHGKMPRGRGQEPRGIFPCKYYFQCKGEMLLVEEPKKRK